MVFLSRLYGGIHRTPVFSDPQNFLSRLYGGIQSASAKFPKNLLSKPPIRRNTNAVNLNNPL